jgi:hypothetical protein
LTEINTRRSRFAKSPPAFLKAGIGRIRSMNQRINQLFKCEEKNMKLHTKAIVIAAAFAANGAAMAADQANTAPAPQQPGFATPYYPYGYPGAYYGPGYWGGPYYGPGYWSGPGYYGPGYWGGPYYGPGYGPGYWGGGPWRPWRRGWFW